MPKHCVQTSVRLSKVLSVTILIPVEYEIDEARRDLKVLDLAKEKRFYCDFHEDKLVVPPFTLSTLQGKQYAVSVDCDSLRLFLSHSLRCTLHGYERGRLILTAIPNALRNLLPSRAICPVFAKIQYYLHSSRSLYPMLSQGPSCQKRVLPKWKSSGLPE